MGAIPSFAGGGVVILEGILFALAKNGFYEENRRAAARQAFVQQGDQDVDNWLGALRGGRW